MQFPNESKSYRAARRKLLRAEIELRRKVESVAALRRKLPLGGAVPEDYLFEEGDPARKVRLSELFGGRDTLVTYSYMYGPSMAKPCPMCTSILDGLNGNAGDIAQRTNLVVIGKSPIRRILDIAEKRNWRNLRIVSSAGTSYNRDYGGETAEGSQMPMMNVFVRRKGMVRHFWGCELLYAKSERGQDGRHADLIWPLWNALDLTPEGRGRDWRPRLEYAN